MNGCQLSLVVVGSREGGPPTALFEVLAPHLDSGRLELVIVTSSDSPATRSSMTAHRLPAGTTIPQQRAAGLHLAQAPWVAMTEDFCVPAAGWADALLASCTSGEAAAIGGPIDRHAGTATAWASTLAEHGRFLVTNGAAEVSDLPEINATYDTERLRAAARSERDGLFLSELNRRLHADGALLRWEPDALMYDVSESQLGGATLSQFHHGRLWAGRKALESHGAYRLLRALATPVLPAVLLARIAGSCRRAGRAGVLLRSLPPLLVLLGAWALGEAAGWIAGSGASLRRWR